MLIPLLLGILGAALCRVPYIHDVVQNKKKNDDENNKNGINTIVLLPPMIRCLIVLIVCISSFGLWHTWGGILFAIVTWSATFLLLVRENPEQEHLLLLSSQIFAMLASGVAASHILLFKQQRELFLLQLNTKTNNRGLVVVANEESFIPQSWLVFLPVVAAAISGQVASFLVSSLVKKSNNNNNNSQQQRLWYLSALARGLVSAIVLFYFWFTLYPSTYRSISSDSLVGFPFEPYAAALAGLIAGFAAGALNLLFKGEEEEDLRGEDAVLVRFSQTFHLVGLYCFALIHLF